MSVTVKTGYSNPTEFFKAMNKTGGGLASELFKSKKNIEVRFLGFYNDESGNPKQYGKGEVKYFAARVQHGDDTGWFNLGGFAKVLAKSPDNVKQFFLIKEDEQVSWNLQPDKPVFLLKSDN